MKEPISFNGQVAIVTGAGRGLGREFALALANYGAKVVVNGRGSNDNKNEQAVAQEIIEQGGEAFAYSASVTDGDAVQLMVDEVLERWGRIDILVNNAGELRDKSFAKTTMQDFSAVINSHLIGAANCTHAVWSHMLAQGYGRVVMITSSAGLAGNFGQAAYAAAKMGMVGLMNTLGLEGERKNVLVNCFAPTGITRINKAVFPQALHDVYSVEKLTAGLVFLASEHAPNRAILVGGAGSFQRSYITMTQGELVDEGADKLLERFDDISNREGDVLLHDASDQSKIELANLRKATEFDEIK